jgi:sarcosine oxidase subunit beta
LSDVAGYEVVVIGGGVIGSSIAYHLARQNRRVLVVERAAPAVEPAASWASAGGVRRQGRDAAEAALARSAIARWPSLSEELGAPMGYRQGGNLYVAEGPGAGGVIAEFVREQQANGFADVRALDRREALEVVPGLAETVEAASYSPADGQADPRLATKAFAGAAAVHGATYWNETDCHGLGRDGERVTVVRTSRGDVAAEWVVLAAGAWSAALAVSAGVHLAVRMRPPQILITSPAPRGTLVPVLGSHDRSLSLKQLDDGSFMLGGGWPGVIGEDQRSYTMLESSIEGGFAAAVGVLPAVGEQTIAKRWCGLEAQSFDAIPFIGPVAELHGLYVATGFSGHGFALSPAVGRAVAEELAGREAPELAGLRLERMAGYDQEAVARFLADDRPERMAIG